MLVKKEDKDTIIKILKKHIETNKISIYKLEKNKIITWKTYNKMIKNTNSTITIETLKKLMIGLRFSEEDKKVLKTILKNEKMKKVKVKNKEIKLSKIVSAEEVMFSINKDLDKKIEEIKTLIEKNSIYNMKIIEPITSKEENEYLQRRKIGSFNSDLENRTLLIKKMWDFNDTILEKWKEFNLLLGINNKEDNIKMKKGLLTIATNLKEIAEKLEDAAFDKNDIDEKEEIIIIK